MNMDKILKESTRFLTSPAGIAFYKHAPCAHCGAEVHYDGTPWFTFEGITTEQAAIEARAFHNMKRITSENEVYNDEDNPDNPHGEVCSKCM